MIENEEIIDSGVSTARIESIRLVGNYRLEVTWAEGERAGRVDLVDLAPAIFSYKFYRPLRNNPRTFQTLRLIDNGYAIAWRARGEIDMSAELVETLATQSITPEQFAEFLKRHDLTQSEAAAMLGRSRRQIANYIKEGPIPRVIALACIGYEAIVGPKKEPEIRPVLNARTERRVNLRQHV